MALLVSRWINAHSSHDQSTSHYSHYSYDSSLLLQLPFLTIINRGYHQGGRIIWNSFPSILAYITSLAFPNTSTSTSNPNPDLPSRIRSTICHSLISDLRSDLSVGGVFREITPRTRLTCCVAGIQVASSHELLLPITPPSAVFQVSRTSSFHYRNSLAPSVGIYTKSHGSQEEPDSNRHRA